MFEVSNFQKPSRQRRENGSHRKASAFQC